MGLSAEERAYLVDEAATLLKHRKRGRLIQLLEVRVADSEAYPDARAQDLDRLLLSVVRVLDAELAEP